MKTIVLLKDPSMPSGVSALKHRNIGAMLRIILACILVIHSFFQAIGVRQEWNIRWHDQRSAQIFTQFTANTSEIAGVVWLLAGLLLLLGAVGYLLRNQWYWIPPAAALLISQVLIITHWQDASYGTIVNLVILVFVIISGGAMKWERKVAREVDSIKRQAASNEIMITEALVANLPKNVQVWLRQANVVGRKNPNVVRLFQHGSMRTNPKSKWMPFEAVQHFTVDPPAFVWSAKVNAFPLVTIAGRDIYQNGDGNMLIKPLYIFTAANSHGQEINQGTLLRFMAEMAWLPQAAVSNYLQWEFIDDHHARATMEYGGTTASGIYIFDDDGNLAGFEALRYGDFDGTYRLEKWSVAATGYKRFNGIWIGHQNEVTWKLKEGDFKWLKLEITAMD